MRYILPCLLISMLLQACSNDSSTSSSKVFGTTQVNLNLVLDASVPVLVRQGIKIESDGSAIGMAQTGNANAYDSQTIQVTFANGSESQIVTTENASAQAIAEKFSLISGIDATATSSATILATSFTNTSNSMSVTLNDFKVQPIGESVAEQILDLGTKINERSLVGVRAVYDALTGNLSIFHSDGADLVFGFEGDLADSFQVQGSDSLNSVVTLSSASNLAVVGGKLTILVDGALTIANASASSPIIADFNGQAFVNNAFTPTDSRTFNHASSSTIYDSLGNPHLLALYFVKQPPYSSGANTWQMHVLVDDTDVGDPLIGSEPSRASYNLVFNSDGSLNTVLSDAILISNWIPLAEDGSVIDALMPMNASQGGGLPVPYPPITSNFEIKLNAHQLASEFRVFDNDQNGLSSSSNPDNPSLLTGRFMASPVHGLTYRSGSFSDTTNASGEFQYRDKEFVTFSVGELGLGSYMSDSIITAFSSNHTLADQEKSKNIVRLLHSLDSDASPENGIDVRDALSNDEDNELAELDLNLPVSMFGGNAEYQAILGRLTNSSTFVPLLTALRHEANEMLAIDLHPPSLLTTKVTLNAQLDNSEPVINAVFDPLTEASYTHALSTEIFDSLGSPHQLELYFVKTSEGEATWKVYLLVDGRYVGDPLFGTAPSASTVTLAFEDNALAKSILISNWDPLDALGNPNGAERPLNFVDGGSLPISLPTVSSNFEIAFDLSLHESEFEVHELYQDGFSLSD
ncbi:MAG: flagellar basal body FlgE domain-containing protein [Oleiphilus sp.]